MENIICKFVLNKINDKQIWKVFQCFYKKRGSWGDLIKKNIFISFNNLFVTFLSSIPFDYDFF